MPDTDQTGPYGTGRFGRGMGPCGDSHSSRWHARHFHRGIRFGWGWRHGPVSPEDEKEWLEQRKGWLETQISAINERLQELVTKKPEATD